MYRTHKDDRLKRGATNSTFSYYESNPRSYENSGIGPMVKKSLTSGIHTQSQSLFATRKPSL